MTADEFARFDCVITKRGRVWRWAVSDQAGSLVMAGAGSSRLEAKYLAARAIFQLLLTATYRSRTAAT
jgi:hypothetical protein